MELDEFRCLNFYEQDEILRNEGIYLAVINDHIDTFILYQVDDFYVELYSRNGNICALNYFEDVELLEPYLNEIDISCVYSLLGLVQ